MNQFWSKIRGHRKRKKNKKKKPLFYEEITIDKFSSSIIDFYNSFKTIFILWRYFYSLNPKCIFICPFLVKIRAYMPLFWQYALILTNFGFLKGQNKGISTVSELRNKRFIKYVNFRLKFCQKRSEIELQYNRYMNQAGELRDGQANNWEDWRFYL